MALTTDISLEPAVLKGIPANILSSVRTAAQRTGVDFSYLVAKAAAESSFDPHAQASTSSARGLYQFLNKTWIDMIKEHGAKYGLGSLASALESGDPHARIKALALRDNPSLSASMAAEYTRDNQQTLEAALGREVGSTDLYLAHFLGAQGATKFLSTMDRNPSARADALFPEAARANRSIFYANGRPRTVSEIYDRFSAKLGAGNEIHAQSMRTAEASTQPVQALPTGEASEADGSSNASPSTSGGFWRSIPRVTTYAPPARLSADASGWANPYNRLSQDAILLLGSLNPPATRRSDT